MTRRLRIAIDPILKARYGPEICWTWRLLLTSIGLPWEEVSINSPKYEIAYLAKDTPIVDSDLCIHANTDYWKKRSRYRLSRVEQTAGWLYPIFEGEDFSLELFRVSNGRIVFQRDIIFYVFWMVTGQEEPHLAKNIHGQAQLKQTAFYKEQVLHSAIASNIGAKLEEQLMKLGFISRIRRWPGAKIAAACVSHDVDYPEVIKWLEPLRIIRRQGLSGFKTALSLISGRRSHWNFASWVSMEKSLNIKSAFYFAARQGSLYKYLIGTPDPFYNVKSDRFREVFRFLKDEGFEIGLHASYRAFESRDKFALEKKVLEEASNQRIDGNRHHYLHMDSGNLESTLLLHEQINLKYDASLIHERYLGWRRGLSWPFFPFHQELKREIKVLQIPTVWMDNQFFGYQRDNSGNRHEILRMLTDRVVGQGGCLFIDIHNYVFDDVLFPGWADTYRKLWEYIIGCSDFWLATPGQIADHWIKRYTFILQASQGLEDGY